MKKYLIMFLSMFIVSGILLSGCSKPEISSESDISREKTTVPSESAEIQTISHLSEEKKVSFVNPSGATVAERFLVPEGYRRVESTEHSFGEFLQTLPLKEDGAKVLYYDGREKARDVYLAVVDYHLGNRDLQQCADCIMRLRAEYFYGSGSYDEIHFNFVSGFQADFSKWRQGYGISVKDNSVRWIENANNNSSYESLTAYLDMVYAYASTLSLEKEMIPRSVSEMAIGDVFIKGGSPGHCVIIVDMAIHETTGETIFMLAQGYMPAQDIQILKGDQEDSPWYSLTGKDILITPEWQFPLDSLRTWEE